MGETLGGKGRKGGRGEGANPVGKRKSLMLRKYSLATYKVQNHDAYFIISPYASIKYIIKVWPIKTDVPIL